MLGSRAGACRDETNTLRLRAIAVQRGCVIAMAIEEDFLEEVVCKKPGAIQMEGQLKQRPGDRECCS